MSLKDHLAFRLEDRLQGTRKQTGVDKQTKEWSRSRGQETSGPGPAPPSPTVFAGRVSPSLPRPLLSHSLNKGAHEHFNRDVLKLLHLSLVFVIWVQRQT